MAKKKSKKKTSRPSAVHVAAALRSGSGAHVDKKKQQNKKACRGQVKETEK